MARWMDEAGPALRGAFVHRVWRDEARWVLLARHHEGGDPEQKPVRRVALEVALDVPGARCLALPPELVGADDDKAKKSQAKDAHPFLGLLRRHLLGTRVEDLRPAPGDRVALLDCARASAPEPSAEEREAVARPRLAIELIGRAGNLVLVDRQGDTCLGALHPGRAPRTCERGAPYRLPQPRPGPALPPEVAPEVAPDPETLALSRAAAALLRAAEDEAAQASRQGQLLRAARQGIKRLEGLTVKLEGELAEVARADELERRADLLKQHLGAIPRGASEARLQDWSSGAAREVVITLDPTEPVQDQMQALYKKARKLRSGEVSIRTRQGEVDQKLLDARSLLERLEAADPEDEAALVKLEVGLRKLAFLPKEAAPRPKVQENQGPRSYRTLEGHEVLVGRSDEENDRLTMQIARGNDLFFHVRGCPGSHVILRVDANRPPNHESLADAAALAVHYSKARNRPSVDVSYTPRKWVKKPRGAKPGLVQISNEKTIRAGGDPERLRRVLASRDRPEEDE